MVYEMVENVQAEKYEFQVEETEKRTSYFITIAFHYEWLDS